MTCKWWSAHNQRLPPLINAASPGSPVQRQEDPWASRIHFHTQVRFRMSPCPFSPPHAERHPHCKLPSLSTNSPPNAQSAAVSRRCCAYAPACGRLASRLGDLLDVGARDVSLDTVG